jgi:plastocyanin
MSLSRVLAAAGVPNDGGRLQWPVGLRVVGGAAADGLRQQIDVLFEEESRQTQAGPVNPHLAQELTRSLGALRKLLRRDREERFGLPLATYEDAERFLDKLDHARKVLEVGLAPSGEKVRLEAREGNADEVGLYDNRFEPPALTVPAGTTVRWTNHGQHKHTVTSDRGDWGSKGLGPAETYSYTFTRPGTYAYHCEVHPEEMRGTVVVK